MRANRATRSVNKWRGETDWQSRRVFSLIESAKLLLVRSCFRVSSLNLHPPPSRVQFCYIYLFTVFSCIPSTRSFHILISTIPKSFSFPTPSATATIVFESLPPIKVKYGCRVQMFRRIYCLLHALLLFYERTTRRNIIHLIARKFY